jgi:hypothetical protein
MCIARCFHKIGVGGGEDRMGLCLPRLRSKDDDAHGARAFLVKPLD